ncbi:MAG: Bro-N domain-containing protein [Bacteroidaceae bacterium]|nr:Bro-N domain-containing protein [Bacteroidaceae bacterium]
MFRTMMNEKGETFFVGKDVAKALGYTAPRNALATHVDEEDKTTALIQCTGSNYKSKSIIINESGLYSLILSSKLDRAREFKHWVTSEVPSSSLSSVANAPTTSGLMRSVSDNRPFELRFQAPRVSRAILPW